MAADPPSTPVMPPAPSEADIAGFLVERFLSGLDAADLDPEYDLLATAVIDSLGILHIASWLADEHGVELPDEELAGRNFRTVRAIRATAGRAVAGQGRS
ncbi:acyl carrier protein [Streptomyces sp. CHD11]|uniref:acyl carrier protein n=1 Tax=Streptomyces sp. CHD11 TaxID=2741325 RepID=UPI001BFCA096|nr:acyl carrier protein [Streptomyces sp. CHD11]MBT3153781.1 acyl carrier protein [Streptomyces sp. CHD11]